MAVRLLLLGCALPLLAGCGTVANMQGKNLPVLDAGGQYEPRPFGGVRNDLRWIGVGFETRPSSATDVLAAAGRVVLWGTDLPFSFVGDIVTLPKVLFAASPKPSEPTAADDKR